MDQLPTILGALVLAAVLWVMKMTSENTMTLKVLQSTIDLHILPELKRLRESGHEVRNIAQAASTKLELLGQRTDQTEQDVRELWDGTDRRAGGDRRETA